MVISTHHESILYQISQNETIEINCKNRAQYILSQLRYFSYCFSLLAGYSKAFSQVEYSTLYQLLEIGDTQENRYHLLIND